MRNAGLDKVQAGIKIAGRNLNNLRYADDTILMAESKKELKSLLMKVKGRSEEHTSELQSPPAVILEPSKIKYITLSIVSPSTYQEVTEPDAKIFIFWMFEF